MDKNLIKEAESLLNNSGTDRRSFLKAGAVASVGLGYVAAAEGGKATEIVVESSFGTRYELSTPDDAASPKIRDQNVNRVPTIRMPF